MIIIPQQGYEGTAVIMDLQAAISDEQPPGWRQRCCCWYEYLR